MRRKEMEVDMLGAENDEPETSFRRGYQQGAIDIFLAIERCLDPTTREVLQAWIEKDVSMWRAKGMLGHPPNWRVKNITGSKSAGRAPRGLEPKEARGAGLFEEAEPDGAPVEGCPRGGGFVSSNRKLRGRRVGRSSLSVTNPKISAAFREPVHPLPSPVRHVPKRRPCCVPGHLHEQLQPLPTWWAAASTATR